MIDMVSNGMIYRHARSRKRVTLAVDELLNVYMVELSSFPSKDAGADYARVRIENARRVTDGSAWAECDSYDPWNGYRGVSFIHREQQLRLISQFCEGPLRLQFELQFED